MIDIEVCKRVPCELLHHHHRLQQRPSGHGAGVGRWEVGPAEAEWALQWRPARTRRPGLSCPAPASLATPASVSIRVDIQRLSSCLYFDLKRDVKNRLSTIDNHFQ